MNCAVDRFPANPSGEDDAGKPMPPPKAAVGATPSSRQFTFAPSTWISAYFGIPSVAFVSVRLTAAPLVTAIAWNEFGTGKNWPGKFDMASSVQARNVNIGIDLDLAGALRRAAVAGGADPVIEFDGVRRGEGELALEECDPRLGGRDAVDVAV